MSSPTPIPPFYRPISFVSPISDTTHTPSHHSLNPFRRLSTYLKSALTLEPSTEARHRESIISDHVDAEHETERRNSVVLGQDGREEQALLEWRRGSVNGFWKKHGSVGGEGEERRRSVVDGEGRGRRGGLGGLGRKWRKMSWGRGSE
ncbi:hypothetical protein BDU57DRAFT_500276 [Ampelomyces quisqualis]|uniref:Uncharacterized protein n=1 Tax=Ampelomyces quisqualis TaxID=50730 RepID=A0A6A5QH84_AMPQU|nr:hypothetical protein BDU57DRAFT_500276 [Ampelomyces quisqualis]